MKTEEIEEEQDIDMTPNIMQQHFTPPLYHPLSSNHLDLNSNIKKKDFAAVNRMGSSSGDESHHHRASTHRHSAPPNKTVFDCHQNHHHSPTPTQQQQQEVGPAAWKCGICQMVFTEDHQLYFHLRVHIPRQERRLCPHCPFVSDDGPGLEEHLREKHFRGIRCTVCKAHVGDTRADLSSHLYSCHIVKKTRNKPWPRFDSADST